jgi:glycosyltransferase involved in cell wall biosynthesis
VKVVAVYNRYLNRGGEDEVFESEIELLRSRGCQVFPVEERTERPSNFVAKIGIAGQSIWSASWHRKFQRLLAETKPDVVHVQNCFPLISPSIYYACHDAGVPVVQTLHNFRLICPSANLYRDGKVCEECMDHSLLRSVRYGCYQESRSTTAAVALMVAAHRAVGTWSRMVDAYITHTEFARQKFIAGGLPAEKIKIKPNFVDPDPGPRAGRGDYALFVGRLSEQKGTLTLINAWKSSRAGVPLVVIGDGPLSGQLESQLSRSEFPNVEYRGRLSRAETMAAMKRARFLVFPSEWYEGFPMTIAESFASGLPVVCGRLGAMKELVKNGLTGLHFEAGDARDLARQVEWAWEHPAEMEAMGAAAYQEYRTRLTGDHNYRILREIYDAAMRSRSAYGRGRASTSPAYL